MNNNRILLKYVTLSGLFQMFFRLFDAFPLHLVSNPSIAAITRIQAEMCGQQTGNNLERIMRIQTPTLLLPNSQKTNPMDSPSSLWLLRLISMLPHSASKRNGCGSCYMGGTRQKSLGVICGRTARQKLCQFMAHFLRLVMKSSTQAANCALGLGRSKKPD